MLPARTRLPSAFSSILLPSALAALLLTSLAAAPAPSRVALLNDALPGLDPDVTASVADSLRRSGLDVTSLSAAEASDTATLSRDRFFLYVIPNASGYPAAGATALTRFLQAKGHLLILGGSPFGNPLWKFQNRWVDQSYVANAVQQTTPGKLAFDFEQAGSASVWTRSGRNSQPTRAELAAGGAGDSGQCLKLSLHYQSGTPDGFGAALPPSAVPPPGRGLLCFWAKGDGQTAQLAVRLIEGPGATQRGIAVIRLTRNWASYVLRPEDFRQIGQADPARATRVCFELIDRNVTPLVAEGKHTVFVDQIGVAPDPFGATLAGEAGERLFPMIETISPGYKVYPLRQVTALRSHANQVMLDRGLDLPTPETAYSCYRRPEGKGLERGYQWRWLPLVQALDEQGAERGTPIWMLIHQAPPNEGPAFEDAARRLAFRDPERHRTQQTPAEGSICAVCAIADAPSLKRIAATNLLGTLALRMQDGAFLSHAGSQEFSYWPGESIRAGAVVVNYGASPAKLDVRVRLHGTSGVADLLDRQASVTLSPGQKSQVSFDGPPLPATGAPWVVTTELLRDGQTIDRIEHEIGLLEDRKAEAGAFITTRNGEFWRQGKKWNPMGVNYWPRSAIALEPRDYTFHWLTPGYYDPEQVDQDLAQLEAMGQNLVCIRAHHRNDRRTLLDFLRRCQRRQIHAFLFVQTHEVTDDPHYFQGIMMPFHFQEEAVSGFLQATRLAENPALLGYDLIWEPAGWVFGGRINTFGWTESEPYRQRWDAAWMRWIEERYGSLANAEADWGMPAPRLNGRVTSPSSDQFSQDGPWRIMVCAYRRFMDNLMSRYWNDVSRKLRQLDPNHLLSYRQGNLPPIDFTLTATPRHVDFFAMEGYGFVPGETGPNAVGFINRYLPFVSRGKPYLWVEFGSSTWDAASMQSTPEKIEAQRAGSELIYQAALENGANGASPWWWAGGYRVSEQSDFGILNPDGTLRPSGELLRDYAPRFQARAAYPAASTWFTLDRDSHAGSHWYFAFHDGAKAFQTASAQGQKLGIRTPATGTTSVNTPLLAVGNTAYNGNNPPKYLDAEFNVFRLRTGQRPWIEVTRDAKIRVPKGVPLTATASVGNLQEATWLTPARAQGQPGAVFLASTAASAIPVKSPIAQDTAWQTDAEFAFSLSQGIATETVVELRMTAEGRAWFGETLRFTLTPEASPP